MDEQLKQSALDFHEFPVPGKIQSRRPNLSPPSAIWRWPTRRASQPPARKSKKIRWPPTNTLPAATLVAVVSNGTAVLGLGNIGALAGKPVMEGKGVLFKKFAGIDVFDIEVDELDRTNSLTSSPPSNQPSAVSTWKILKRRSVSTSSSSCASG